MATATVHADDKAIHDYHERLKIARKNPDTTHEGNIRHAFANLLESTAKTRGWQLVQEQTNRVKGRTIRYDGVLRDSFNLPYGHWEAKDTADDLETEIRKKRDAGYAFKNIIFEDSQSAVLIQDGDVVVRAPVDDSEKLADLLTRFYAHEIEPFNDFNAAIAHFQSEVKHIATSLNDKIKSAHKDNKKFQTAFTTFMELCRTALNPNIRQEAVDEMLIQHMLTERLIRKVFNVEEFIQRNVIAAEIETVIAALTSQYFNRTEFLGALDRYYHTIERAADEFADDFTEKQRLLNTVYERFFQGYSVKVADTHGIVYTPQEIVDFMCAAVEEVLMDEFGLHLGDEDVKIIDPATGTGNFIVNLLNRVDARDIDRFYKNQLFANEVMLLPYYVASLNIEHAYYERTGRYESFEGISFVDTLDLAEGAQMRLAFMTEKNTERVERQKNAKINVIIGNPPYNMGQVNENDNNKNRTYTIIDKRVGDTYSKDSNSNNRNALYDAYVKFFRWATDRLGENDGVVCFVSNNGFVDGIVFNGMRKHLMQDFSLIYHVDLAGNARTAGERRRKEAGNVFDDAIRVGIGITVAIRSSKHKNTRIKYFRIGDYLSSADKRLFLADHVERMGRHNSLNTISWQELTPNKKYTWIVPEYETEYDALLRIGSKEAKRKSTLKPEVIFEQYSSGIKTNRDSTVYDYDSKKLIERIKSTIQNYNSEIDRYKRDQNPQNIDDFVDYSKLDWSYWLKQHLRQEHYITFNEDFLRSSLYRPFNKQTVYFDPILINSRTLFPYFLSNSQSYNKVISLTDKGSSKPFMVLISEIIPDLHLVGAGASCQCFPFYTYDEDGNNRRENITDWALAQFRTHYQDDSITKWDIFYYVYGLLHHPAYRERYADNLKRELPRIPFAPDFRAFSTAGKQLADLHLNYETVKPYRLTWETKEPVSYKVEKMRLKGKRSVSALTLNPSPVGEGLGKGDQILPFSLREKGLGDEGNLQTSSQEKGSGDEGYSGDDEGKFRAMASQAMVKIARDLRQRQTPAEVILWEALRSRRLNGLKFRRQHPIANTAFVVDFFCYDAQLAIELDGGIHLNQQDADADRQAAIEAEGWRVIRFSNDEVYDNLQGVLVKILEATQQGLVNTDASLPFSREAHWEKGSGDEGDDEGFSGDEGNHPTYSIYDRLEVNHTLTMKDIPPQAFDYRLGNRSALEWIVDQYQVKTDKRSGITSDPNQYSDDERYIVDLVEKVVAVSVQTVKIVDILAQLPFRTTEK